MSYHFKKLTLVKEVTAMNYEKRFGYDGKEKLSLKQWKTDDTAGFNDQNEALEEIECI